MNADDADFGYGMDGYVEMRAEHRNPRAGN
jgi:hypothetical protein